MPVHKGSKKAVPEEEAGAARSTDDGASSAAGSGGKGLDTGAGVGLIDDKGEGEGGPEDEHFGVQPPAGNRQIGVVEFLEFVRSLGIDPATDNEMLWIAEEAFQAPLPPGWSEHEDETGLTYFHRMATGESVWQHPMDGLYREIVGYHRQATSEGGFWHIDEELTRIQDEIQEDLKNWMDLHDEQGFKFYFHTKTEESRYDDPRSGVYHELYARIRLVAKLKERLPLLAMAPRPDVLTPYEVELQKIQESEEDRYMRSVIKIQALFRAKSARKRAKELRLRSIVGRGHQPLKSRIQLKLKAVGRDGRKELVLAECTPHRRNKAASKIQARIRGALTRASFKPMMDHRQYLNSQAAKIQRVAKVYAAVRLAERREERRRQKAATDINRLVRGFLARRYVKRFSVERRKFLHYQQCVITLQCMVRCKLARNEVKRRKRQAFAPQVKQLQSACKMYLAQSRLIRYRLQAEPATCIFTLNKTGHGERFMPWSFNMILVPRQEVKGSRGGTKDPKLLSDPYGPIDIFEKACFGNVDNVAATKMNSLVRMFLGRRRYKRRIEEKITRERMEKEALEAEERRQNKAATYIQKMFRGHSVRRKDVLGQKYFLWRDARIDRCEIIQAYIETYMAKDALFYRMEEMEKDFAATQIQAVWRGWLARKSVEVIKEQLLWPVKGWFSYTATGRDCAQVEVQFFPNPRFDGYAYFLQYGSMEELHGALDSMEKEVTFCANRLGVHEPIPEHESTLKQKDAKGSPAAQTSGKRRGSLTGQEKRGAAGDGSKAPSGAPTPSNAGGSAVAAKGAPSPASSTGGQQSASGGMLAATAGAGKAGSAGVSPASAATGGASGLPSPAAPGAGGRSRAAPAAGSSDDDMDISSGRGGGGNRRIAPGLEIGADEPMDATGRPAGSPKSASIGGVAGSAGGPQALSPKTSPAAGGLSGTLAGAVDADGLPLLESEVLPEPEPEEEDPLADGRALKVLKKAATTPGQGSHYAGTWVNGQFVKSRVDSVDGLSEAHKQQLMADLERQRRDKVEELIRRQKKHTMKRQKAQRRESSRLQGDLGMDVFAEDAPKAKAHELQRWLKKKEFEAMERQMQAEGEEDPRLAAALRLEQERAATRERRLRVAEKRRDNALASAGKAPDVKSFSTGMGRSERVIHRHVHHHMHHHDGADEEAPQSPLGPPFAGGHPQYAVYGGFPGHPGPGHPGMPMHYDAGGIPGGGRLPQLGAPMDPYAQTPPSGFWGGSTGGLGSSRGQFRSTGDLRQRSSASQPPGGPVFGNASPNSRFVAAGGPAFGPVPAGAFRDPGMAMKFRPLVHSMSEGNTRQADPFSSAQSRGGLGMRPSAGGSVPFPEGQAGFHSAPVKLGRMGPGGMPIPMQPGM